MSFSSPTEAGSRKFLEEIYRDKALLIIRDFISGSLGRGQVVRHQVLVLAFGGSNPSDPARNEFLSPIIPANIALKET